MSNRNTETNAEEARSVRADWMFGLTFRSLYNLHHTFLSRRRAAFGIDHRETILETRNGARTQEKAGKHGFLASTLTPNLRFSLALRHREPVY